jgi:carboxymethylenebutenolidase
VLAFADNDERINAAWPAYEAALKSAGVKHEAHGAKSDT